MDSYSIFHPDTHLQTQNSSFWTPKHQILGFRGLGFRVSPSWPAGRLAGWPAGWLAGWLAGLDPGGEDTWSGEGKLEFLGPYSQESRLPTAVLRTPPTGLQRPSGLQDYKTARTAGLLTATKLHSLVAPGGPADISYTTHVI